MKKILIFGAFIMLGIQTAIGAVRDGNATTRQKNATTSQRVASTTVKTDRPAGTRTVAEARTATQKSTASRAAVARGGTQTVSPRTGAATTTPATPARSTTTRRTANQTPVISRAAAPQTPVNMSDTRTGAEYEKCKTAYFTCMDQFCQLKNDDYRRCSCSNRVHNLASVRDTMQQAGQELTTFNNNLDVVGMTAAQAASMRNASEGENALTSDVSASKALLQAIMNSIRGEDTTVGGKYADLNRINISFDTANAFGTLDAGQAIAAYNGQELYNAVYPQCRAAVKADCNDASLQRAITAYLMAIEQDCNTVQTAIESTQKQMKSAVRESSALLDLARVENRQKHNSSDFTTCLNAVEQAVLSEEVCGAGYHRCLDNGEFIDISTGKPIAGVERFYELEKLLTFRDGVDNSNQKLSKITNNRSFVTNFEKRVKKFAEPALDKCTEQADEVWAEYLDKALLDIYYAQKSKVAEIKRGCFDFVSSCYMNGDNAITAAMRELTGDSSTVVQPDKIALNNEMCREYVASCDNMFDGNIIKDYIDNRKDTDTLTACRAAVKQCFDKFGGTNYENFYYPYSGIISTTGGAAIDWFTLYECNGDGICDTSKPKSECARQLAEIESCKDPDVLEKAFGGFNSMPTIKQTNSQSNSYYYEASTSSNAVRRYGTQSSIDILQHRVPRSTGVATEIYNQIIDILSIQCRNVQGRFVEVQSIKDNLYQTDNYCISQFNGSKEYGNLINLYAIGTNENMCPRDYTLNVDTQSWGACLCWENGGRRSKWGQSAKCVAELPVQQAQKQDENGTPVVDDNNNPIMEFAQDRECRTEDKYGKYKDVLLEGQINLNKNISIDTWCTLPTKNMNSKKNQVCPLGGKPNSDGLCTTADGTILDSLPEGITF